MRFQNEEWGGRVAIPSCVRMGSQGLQQVARSAVFACFLLFSASLHAQIDVGVTLDHSSYMIGEAFTARVRIENQLSLPLVFDDEFHNAELVVELNRRRSGRAPEGQRRPVSRDIVIMPAERKLELVEVTSLFDIREPGSYVIRAGVRYDGTFFLSQALGFDVVTGVEVVSAHRSLPGYDGVHLHYSLRYWRRHAAEHAFMVIRDAANDIIYGTFPLGPIVRVNRPVIRFTPEGDALVIHQSGRGRITRSLIEVSGRGAALTSQTHHRHEGGRPQDVPR